MLNISYFCPALFVLVGEEWRGRRGLWTHNPPLKSDLFMNSSPVFPPSFLPLQASRESTSLPEVIGWCLQDWIGYFPWCPVISYLYKAWYGRTEGFILGYSPWMNSVLPYQIWFLQLEQFPLYVPPSRLWRVPVVKGQSLVLHTFTRHVFIFI